MKYRVDRRKFAPVAPVAAVCAECRQSIVPGGEVIVMDGRGKYVICFDCKDAYDNDLLRDDRVNAWDAAVHHGLVHVGYEQWDGLVSGQDWLSWFNGE